MVFSDTGILCTRRQPVVIVDTTRAKFTHAPPIEISILPQASEALNKYRCIKWQKFVISPLHLTRRHVNWQHGTSQQISPPFYQTEHVSCQLIRACCLRNRAAFNSQIAPSSFKSWASTHRSLLALSWDQLTLLKRAQLHCCCIWAENARRGASKEAKLQWRPYQ